MDKKEAIREVKYQCKKRWFRSMFKNWEWQEFTGKDILNQARYLGYKITTNDFYKLRREIIKELEKPETNLVPTPREIKESLAELPDISINEMVDRAIRLIREEK